MEIDPRDGYRTVSAVEDIERKLQAIIRGLPAHVRPVIVADWRTTAVLTPPVAERVVAMMTATNTRIERSAILHAGEASTSVLQLVRLIKETSVPYRRLFTEPALLQLWLEEILTREESERLREFLMSSRRASQRQ
ncbi:MAG TPA: hypothetical protein VFX59_30115 [Polyangiales bacterium]|nr:hypothetical protein [Polyangiales bacterium]